jgi:hypothetical protein
MLVNFSVYSICVAPHLAPVGNPTAEVISVTTGSNQACQPITTLVVKAYDQEGLISLLEELHREHAAILRVDMIP